MSDLWDVDDWVEEAARLPIAKFYPSAITKGTGVPTEDVFRKLLTFVEEGRLFIRWQIRCQSYECVRTIEEVDDVQEPIGTVVHCLCGEYYEISPDMLFPVFGIEKHFRSRVRDRAKKKDSRQKEILGDLRQPPVNLPGVLNPRDIELFQRVSPGAAVHVYQHYYYGGVEMAEKKTEFHIGSVNTTQSSVAFGDQNTLTTTNESNKQVQDTTAQLIELLKQHDIPQESKDELVGTIQEAAAQATNEKPNRTIIRGLVTAAKTMVSAFESSPALITAYEAWAHALHPILGS